MWLFVTRKRKVVKGMLFTYIRHQRRRDVFSFLATGRKHLGAGVLDSVFLVALTCLT